MPQATAKRTVFETGTSSCNTRDPTLITFLARRMIHNTIAMVSLIVLVFIMSRLTGDPAALYLPEDATADQLAAFRAQHGLDEPVWIQFLNYMGGIAHLDFGVSLRRGMPVMDIVFEALPWTLRLAGITIFLAMLVALSIGPIAAYRPGSSLDRVVNVLSLAAASTPDFWIALVGILVFSLSLGWLPTSGVGGLPYWILPIAVLMLKITGTTTQVVRGSMISTLAMPFIKGARAKGVQEQRIVFAHALRNSAISAITVAGDQARGLINGAVVVESVFGWPGVGKLLVDSVAQRDFAVVQATVLVTATCIFLLNAVLDVCYALLDPRIRLD